MHLQPTRTSHLRKSHPSRKIRKGIRTKERIIREAIDLFTERGYANTSTRELVRRLGMTKSSIYSHFSSKDEILGIIVQRAGTKVLATLNEVIEKNDDPVECLKRMIFRFVCLLEVMSKETSIFASELAQLPAEYKETCAEQHRQIYNLFRGKIREIEGSHFIDSNYSTLVSFSILGAINWVYRWHDDAGSLSMKDVADGIVNLVFDGILRGDIKNKEDKKFP
jgi:AcrR family transcriptional regulator